jgi:uncharacterized membrane protein
MLRKVGSSAMAEASEFNGVSALAQFVEWLQLGAESLSAIIICVGIVVAAYSLIQMFMPSRRKSYHQIRLSLSRFLALALELQLAADLLGTVVQPSWDQLGKLGAIAAIRTFLNYFLAREINEEEERIKRDAGQSSIRATD